MDFIISTDAGTEDHGRIGTSEPGWTTPARGLRVPGDVSLDHRLIAGAAIRASQRLAVACDLTAAHFWSLVVPSGFGLDVDAQACAIATVRDGSRHRAGGVRGRRLELPDDHVTTLDGILLTTPARTWLDCAALVRFADVVAMGDALLRHELATRPDLAAMLRWGRGRRGIRFARWAFEILDPAAESPGESWVRAGLVRAKVPAPVCNHSVEIAGFSFRLDMAWPQAKVAVEYDGVEYHGPDRASRDAWRRRLLQQAGWIVIVVRKEDLRDLGSVALAVRKALSTRAATGRSRGQ